MGFFITCILKNETKEDVLKSLYYIEELLWIIHWVDCREICKYGTNGLGVIRKPDRLLSIDLHNLAPGTWPLGNKTKHMFTQPLRPDQLAIQVVWCPVCSGVRTIKAQMLSNPE